MEHESQVCEDKLKNVVKKNTFTLHGLWPSLRNGQRIPECHKGTQIKPDGSAVYTQMSHFWPSFKGDNIPFWDHEYNKHGFCYSQHTKTTDPKAFFEKVIEVYNSNSYEDLFLKMNVPAGNM